MTLKVVGAGVGRTGTLSLKTGLEQLLGQPCYHMLEVFTNPEHVAVWRAAGQGRPVDWVSFFSAYGATSDFPACLFWREILEANPDAVVVLSTRADTDTWWQSASHTIFAIEETQLPPEMSEWFEMWRVVASSRFTPTWRDESAACAAYERHNAEVRASVPAEKLVEWQAGDGWEPLCRALGLEVPREPFPHLNTREEFPLPSKETSVSDAIEQLSQSRPLA